MRGPVFTTVAAVLSICTVAQASQIYLHPPSYDFASSPSANSADTASRALAHHLGLEAFEPLGGSDFLVETVGAGAPFVGQGQKDGLLLAIDERDAQEILPSSLKAALQISTPPLESLTELVNTYVHRASQTFSKVYSASDVTSLPPPRMLDVFSFSGSSGDAFISEISVLVDLIESPRSTEGDGSKFGALELTGLRALADAHGADSDAYRTAASAGRAVLESALSKPDFQLAVVTFSPENARSRRQPQQSPLPRPGKPQVPIGSSARCFDSAEACGNATSACSGHGECVSAKRAGNTCFVCACGTTTSKSNATEYWAGEQCQKKDISASFALIAGTVIGLIVLVGGSISLLYTVGNIELPGTLSSTAGPIKRD